MGLLRNASSQSLGRRSPRRSTDSPGPSNAGLLNNLWRLGEAAIPQPQRNSSVNPTCLICLEPLSPEEFAASLCTHILLICLPNSWRRGQYQRGGHFMRSVNAASTNALRIAQRAAVIFAVRQSLLVAWTMLQDVSGSFCKR